MKRNPQVIAFMTPFPYSVDVDAPLKEAHALMREHRLRRGLARPPSHPSMTAELCGFSIVAEADPA